MPEDTVVLVRRKRGYGSVFLPVHQHTLEEGDTWLMLASEVANRPDFEQVGDEQGDTDSAKSEPYAPPVISTEPARPTPESFANYVPVHEDEEKSDEDKEFEELLKAEQEEHPEEE